MVWNADSENIVELPDGRQLSVAAGIDAEEARKRIVAQYPELFNVQPEEDPSGFFPGMLSAWENYKGIVAGMPAATAAGSELLGGSEENRQKLLESARQTYEEYGERASEILPDPASVESIGEAYDEEGLWGATGETVDFIKQSIGQQVPIFAGLGAAQRIGSTKFVQSTVGRAGTALASRLLPAAAAPFLPAAFSNPWTGAAAGLAVAAAFAYSSMLRDNAEKAEDLEDIAPLRAAAAAVPHAAMEYLGFAMTGVLGPLKQRLAADTLKATLAGTSTRTGRSAWKAAGKQGARSLSEFPTELAQTVIERAQRGDSISLEDADFVTELIETAAATAPVVGAFGGYGSYRSYKKEKSDIANFERDTEQEKAVRESKAEERRKIQDQDEARSARIQRENEERFTRAVGDYESMNERIAEEALAMAGREPVYVSDVIEVFDSRGIDSSSQGAKAFLLRNTNGEVKSLHGLKDNKNLSNAERTKRARYRRRIHSILSGMRSYEYDGTTDVLDLNMFTQDQFNQAIEGTRKLKRIGPDNIRQVLNMGNSKIEQSIASKILNAMKERGYATRVTQKDKTRPFMVRNPGYNEVQYDEILRQGRESGRITQEMYEKVTNNYGKEKYDLFISDMRNRRDIPEVDARPGVIVPILNEVGIGEFDVGVESDSGYFIKDGDQIVGGATDINEARDLLKRMKKRSVSYSVVRNGEVVATLKNSTEATAYLNDQKERDPDAAWERRTNPAANLTLDKSKSRGLRVVERFYDENDNLTDIYEDSFVPDEQTAAHRMEARRKEYEPSATVWDKRSGKTQKKAIERLSEQMRGRGLLNEPRLEDFQTRDSRRTLDTREENTEKENKVLDSIRTALDRVGLTGIAAAIDQRIGDKTGDAFAAFDQHRRAIAVALDKIQGAETQAEIDEAIANAVSHELIHALRELDLFTPGEWLAISRSVARVKIGDQLRQKYPDAGLPANATYWDWATAFYSQDTVGMTAEQANDYILEEAVAQMYADYITDPYVNEQITGQTKGLLDRIRLFLERLYNSISGLGYGDAGDVFASIGKGSIGTRKEEIRTFRPRGGVAVDTQASEEAREERRSPDYTPAQKNKYQRFSRAPGSELIEEEIPARLGFDQGQLLEALRSQMYDKPIPEIIVKELLQNSWDSVKAAVELGSIPDGAGKIDIIIDQDNYTITVSDNGRGMDAKILQDAFFTIAGTFKEGLDPTQSSGGYGFAKAAFLLDPDSIDVDTVRDGFRYRVSATSDTIKNGEFSIKKSKTDLPSGTTVVAHLPRTFSDRRTQEIRDLELPDVPRTLRKPLVGDVDVTLSSVSLGETISHRLWNVGKNFLEDDGDFAEFKTLEFPWGYADIYLGKEESVYMDAMVLSSGVYQFDLEYNVEKEIRKALPYNAVIDIRSKFRAGTPSYPISNDRERFKAHVNEDVDSIARALIAHGRSIEEKIVAKTFASTMSMDRIPFDELVGKRRSDQADWLDRARIGVDSSVPLFHNNTNFYTEKPLPEEAQRLMSEIGSIVIEFRDLVAFIPDYEVIGGEGGVEYASGISIDRGYQGVHIRKPFKGFFLNPFGNDMNTPEGVGGNWWVTLTHEAAHTNADGHGKEFNKQNDRIQEELAELGYEKLIRGAIRNVLDRNWDLYTTLRSEYGRHTIENIGKSLESGQDRRRSEGEVAQGKGGEGSERISDRLPTGGRGAYGNRGRSKRGVEGGPRGGEEIQRREIEPTSLSTDPDSRFQRTGTSGDGTPSSNFMDEFIAISYPNPFDNYERVFGVGIDDETYNVNVEIADVGSDNSVRLGWIQSTPSASKENRGSGVGSYILKKITDLADKHGVTIEGTVARAPGMDKELGLSVSDLKKWYKRNGFEDGEGADEIIRSPKKVDPDFRFQRTGPHGDADFRFHRTGPLLMQRAARFTRLDNVETDLMGEYIEETRHPAWGMDGLCQRCAAQFAWIIRGDYVEGILTGGIPRREILHAWVEKDGNVYDPVNNVAVSKVDFETMIQPEEMYRETGEEAVARADARGFFELVSRPEGWVEKDGMIVPPEDTTTPSDPDSRFQRSSLPAVSPSYGEEFANQIFNETPGFIPRISTRPARDLDVRPEIEDREALTERQRKIARGETEGMRFSRADINQLNNSRRTKPLPPDVQKIQNRVSPVVEEKSFFDYIKMLWDRVERTKFFSKIRQDYIDKYEAISQIARRANDKRRMNKEDQLILADVNSASAAYLSDKAIGIVSESITSGQPVYRDGRTYVDYEKQGLFEILKDVYQGGHIHLWHTWMIHRRESRFEKDRGFVVGSTSEERTKIDNYVRENGLLELFEQTNTNYQKWNENLVEFMKDTGIVNNELGEVFKSFGDYIPFYRVFEGEASDIQQQEMATLMGESVENLRNTINPETGQPYLPPPVAQGASPIPNSMFGSLTGAKLPKAAKGGSGLIVDPLEAMMMNLQAAVTSGMKNVAAQRVMRDAEYLSPNGEFVTRVGKGEGNKTIRYKGEEIEFLVHDQLLFDSLSGMMEGRIGWMGLFSGPSTLLREMVTRSPDFIVANLLRDSISTWVASGTNMKPFLGTFGQFFKGGIAGRGEVSQSMKNLVGAGIIGGYDYGIGTKGAKKVFEQKMRQSGMTVGGKKGSAVIAPMKKIWDWAGDVTTKSDAATRAAVYEDVYKTLIKKGHSVKEAEAEAIFQAGEILNFSRRGRSGLARFITTAIPFLNARVQGLDLLYRAGRNRYSSDYTKLGAKRNLLSMLARGGVIASMTGMYAMLVHDDDEWQAASEQVRDDYWILPSFGGMPSIRIPIPFEVGVIFKVIPERFIRNFLAGDTELAQLTGISTPEEGYADNRQTADSIKRAIISTFEINPFEIQATKPILEVLMNHSFFTGRPIIPPYMTEDAILAERQKRPNTAALAVAIADLYGGSPMKVEHLLRGYTGTVGTWITMAVEDSIRTMKGMPAKAELRTDQWPMVRRFLQSDLGASGQVNDFYTFREDVRRIVNTINDIRNRDRDPKAAREMAQENREIMQVKGMVDLMSKRLADIRNAQQRVYLSDMSPPEKLKEMNRFDQMRKATLQRMPELRKKANLSFSFFE